MTGASRSSRVARTPLVLLGLMTVLSFGSPFGVAWVLSGGRERAWPPDRPVEWVALIGCVVAVGGLMIVLLVMGLANLKAMKAEVDRAKGRASARTPE